MCKLIIPLKYLQMSSIERGETRDPGGAVRAGQPEHQDIEDQRARIRRLTEDGADEYEISREVDTLASLLSKVIIPQSARVRKLKTNRAGKSRIAEAERRLESLKAEFLADTEREWSDVRDEGPILLTSNAVRGNEVRLELKQRLLELRRQNIIR